MSGSYYFDYRVDTDTWHLAYEPTPDMPNSQPEDQAYFSDGATLADDTWTAFVSPYDVSPNTGIGLVLQLTDGTFLELLAHLNPPADIANVWFVPFPGTQVTLRVRSEAGYLTLDYSQDETIWTHVADFAPSSAVIEVGLVLRYDDEAAPAAAQAGFVRLIPGTWDNAIEELALTAPPSAPTPPPPLVGLHTTAEPFVHIIVGAQFGDLEFDVGKCVRWLTYFSDNVFILDINLGTQRYWVVNWTITFPDAKHRVTGINFFYDPVAFRQEQWKLFRQEFGEPQDEDWILFCDAHEGFSVDTRSLPDDYEIAPFMSWIWREITRAQELGQTSVVLPTYPFLRADDLVNITYDSPANGLGSTPWINQVMSTPYYLLPTQGLRRLYQASELRKPDFDWAGMDRWQTPDPAVKAQLISYAYAHWNLLDIPPGQTKVAPLTEANDDGWRQRNLLSRVRPIPGLPVGTWQPPSADPPGSPGPWAAADPNGPVQALNPADMTPATQPVTPAAGTEGILTPMYHTMFRIDLRDGVWYEDPTASGNIPLRWDEVAQDWVPTYDPNQWPDIGVKSALV